jgi:hypothetical protein
MKTKFILFLLIIASLSGFSQSFSVDSKSLSVPRYANQATITAAIPTPTEGMLVFNNALDLYSYYNGTAWVNFPTTAGGQTNPIDSTRIISAAKIPSLQGLKMTGTTSAPGITAAGRIFNIQTYGQTSTGSVLSSEISFRAPQAFSAFNSASDIVFSTKSISTTALVDRMMIDKDGKIAFGSISTAGFLPSGNMDLNFTNSFPDSPTLHIRGSSTTHIRYSRNNATNGAGVGILQTNTNGNNAPANASISWTHYDDTVNPILQTPMMSVTGQGNLTVNGFTKLGGTATDVPAIKQKIFTGTTSSSNLTTTVTHGLDATKIVGFQVIILGGTSSNIYVSDNNQGTGLTFASSYDATDFYITRSSNGTQLVGKQYKVLVTYTN